MNTRIKNLGFSEIWATKSIRQKATTSGNSSNGYNHKTIISDYGESEIAIPRDRNGEFEPRILEKRQTRTDEIEQ